MEYFDLMTKELYEVACLAQKMADLNDGAVEFSAGFYTNGLITHLRATAFPTSAVNPGTLQLEPWHKPPFNPQPPHVKIEKLKNDPRLMSGREFNQRFSSAVIRQLDPVQLRAALRTKVPS